jgi:hypothetical protein
MRRIGPQQKRLAVRGDNSGGNLGRNADHRLALRCLRGLEALGVQGWHHGDACAVIGFGRYRRRREGQHPWQRLGTISEQFGFLRHTRRRIGHLGFGQSH